MLVGGLSAPVRQAWRGAAEVARDASRRLCRWPAAIPASLRAATPFGIVAGHGDENWERRF